MGVLLVSGVVLLRLFAQLFQDFPIVTGAGFAEGGVVISGHQRKVFRQQIHPGQAGAHALGREKRVGGQNQGVALLAQGIHDLAGQGRGRDDFTHRVERAGVEFLHAVADDAAAAGQLVEYGPEALFVGAGAVVAHHGGGAGP